MAAIGPCRRAESHAARPVITRSAATRQSPPSPSGPVRARASALMSQTQRHGVDGRHTTGAAYAPARPWLREIASTHPLTQETAFPLPLREWAGGTGRDAPGRTIRRVVAGQQSGALIEINAPDCGPTPAARGTWPPVGCYACRTVQNRPNERRNARVPAEKIVARPGITHHAQEKRITAPPGGMGCAASPFRF